MRWPTTPTLRSLIVVIAVATAGTASCATTSSAPPGGKSGSAQSSSARPSSGQSPSATPTTPATPVSCPGTWRTGPLAVSHQVAVPPVPVATAISAGSHPDCKFDRLVIDISGAMPGYSVRFVPRVIRDGSGNPLIMPGTSYLVITLKPAQGHSASGAMTLPGKVQTVSYPMLKSYAVAGDFEGVLSVALGLAGGSRYRVGELPGKLYIDVAW